VEALPAAVPVDDPLLLPEAAAPVGVAPDADACDAVRGDPGTEEAELTEAVFAP
jgi:hypothetical protein